MVRQRGGAGSHGAQGYFVPTAGQAIFIVWRSKCFTFLKWNDLRSQVWQCSAEARHEDRDDMSSGRSAAELGIMNRMPHDPALCVGRLGTLRGHRSLSLISPCPRQHRLRRLGLVAPKEIVIRLCADDCRETRKSPISNTKLSGARDLKPGPHGPEPAQRLCPSVSWRCPACPCVLNRRARRVVSSRSVPSWFRNCVTQL
jgi:hypothetical protein